MGSSDRGGFIYLDVDRALEQIGEAEALHDMLDMLQSSLDRDLPQIQALLDSGDVRSANRLLHAIKGFIPIFCVDALCDHVASVELLSKTASAAEVTAAFALLEPKLRGLQSEIDAHLV
ncbi:Hpt domain-containing protein [Curvibacter sp. APW13]|uniref:Hpt domain-containing protein n=1 Tax=Curvibacter sp. APW13 TaxID=3077236 RepID=UPI0028DFE076|nr:Hpt domain-containing protein [Curvibacter sp. APW13]MDT8991583.1 Hpt domain-containing protein [Curvibacter sp. APW13]